MTHARGSSPVPMLAVALTALVSTAPPVVDVTFALDDTTSPRLERTAPTPFMRLAPEERARYASVPDAQWLQRAPRGDRAVVGDGDAVHLFSGGKHVATIAQHLALSSVEMSDDGAVLLVVLPAKTLVVDANGRTKRTLPRAHNAALAGNGKTCALAIGEDVHIVELATGEVVRKVPALATAMSLSRDGRTLTLSTHGGPARTFDTKSALEQRVPERHASRMPGLDMDAALSVDGARVASVAWDGLRLFDARTGARTKLIAMSALDRPDVAFDEDGRHVHVLADHRDGAAPFLLRTVDLATGAIDDRPLAAKSRAHFVRVPTAATDGVVALYFVDTEGALVRMDPSTDKRTRLAQAPRGTNWIAIDDAGLPWFTTWNEGTPNDVMPLFRYDGARVTELARPPGGFWLVGVIDARDANAPALALERQGTVTWSARAPGVTSTKLNGSLAVVARNGVLVGTANGSPSDVLVAVDARGAEIGRAETLRQGRVVDVRALASGEMVALVMSSEGMRLQSVPRGAR
jgi:hypothetical protein